MLLAVATGGALGSVVRFSVGVWATRLFGVGFPYGTFFINVSGSFLIGFFVESFALRWNLSQEWRTFLTVGICGGYTTFSTFSLDAYALIERGQLVQAAAYIVGSVVLGIAALVGGMYLRSA